MPAPLVVAVKVPEPLKEAKEWVPLVVAVKTPALLEESAVQQGALLEVQMLWILTVTCLQLMGD